MKSIIITGANRGIGYQCALQMAKMAPDLQIILACRNNKAGNEALKKIKQATNHQFLICLPLDLASQQSIKAFRSTFAKLPDPHIKILINNAGLQNVDETKYTIDGYEETFGVNHLGTFALTQLLLPFMTQDARITFTSSGTHDPKQKTGMPAPEYTNANALAYPEGNSDKHLKSGQTRYTTSKLCNILTVYKLQAQLSKTGIHVNAFDPGLVPGTGLARNYPPFLKFIADYIFKVMILFHPNVHTAKRSGINLANLSYAPAYSMYKGKYFEGKKLIKSSEDSYNTTYQNELWESSLKLTNTQFTIFK